MMFAFVANPPQQSQQCFHERKESRIGEVSFEEAFVIQKINSEEKIIFAKILLWVITQNISKHSIE